MFPMNGRVMKLAAINHCFFPENQTDPLKPIKLPSFVSLFVSMRKTSCSIIFVCAEQPQTWLQNTNCFKTTLEQLI